MNFRITAGIVYRNTGHSVFPAKNHQEQSLEGTHTWLTEYAWEWAGMPPPPPIEELQKLLADGWDEDLGLGEFAFTLDVLGPNHPQVLNINILAHD